MREFDDEFEKNERASGLYIGRDLLFFRGE
jgi:hypothetical protein